MAVETMSSMDILGDFAADLEVKQGSSATDVYNIGGSFVAGARLRFPDGGLAGQIIFNEQNDSGTWSTSGQVIVDDSGGPIVLDEPVYADTSSNPFGEPYDLGGGAVGLIPFSFNAVETREANESAIASGAPASIDLIHYGPVTDLAGGEEAVLVERKLITVPFGQPNPWVDVTSSFSISIDGRVVTLAGSFDCTYKYRVTPEADELVCDGTAALLAQEVDVTSYSYTFDVYCVTDLSQNGTTDTPDPVLWAQNPVDINDDGVADAADLQEIFDAMD